MKNREKQSLTNPYPNSDSNKRYYTYDFYLKRTFGGKCAKIPLDAGFTCPNMDGRCGVGGCIYCSSRGSGDFAESATLPIPEQYARARERLSSKWSVERCIPYFQARTNTYASVEEIREKFEAALACEGVVGLNVATRADCLPQDVLAYLAEISERTALCVELGLQTVHDTTARLINRGHTLEDFLTGYRNLRSAAPKAQICVHLILGLPDETDGMMLESVRRVGELKPDMVKLHLLHVLRGTRLAEMYERGEYVPLERERYVRLVAESIALLPENTVIARLTGDGMADDLLAPDWSRKKTTVINDIDKYLYSHNMWQGKSLG